MLSPDEETEERGIVFWHQGFVRRVTLINRNDPEVDLTRYDSQGFSIFFFFFIHGVITRNLSNMWTILQGLSTADLFFFNEKSFLFDIIIENTCGTGVSLRRLNIVQENVKKERKKRKERKIMKRLKHLLSWGTIWSCTEKETTSLKNKL